MDILGGKVLSATTDGFITNIDNLEEKIVKGEREGVLKAPLLKTYSEIREVLSGDNRSLEKKHSDIKGIIS